MRYTVPQNMRKTRINAAVFSRTERGASPRKISNPQEPDMYEKFGKRLFDLLFSALALIVLSPVCLIIMIAIKLDSPGPVFFKQKRVGRNGRYFNIVKFRTMKTTAPGDVPTHLLENPELYITRLGRFLRKSSLDELPQLAQILTGRMSIVGPRPALWNQYDLIEERESLGVNVLRPGLTGWAQINGRDTISIEEKARLDAEYLSRLSFRFDLYCILLTVKKVLKSEGVAEGGRPGEKLLQGALRE